jgi:hypothetical protein
MYICPVMINPTPPIDNSLYRDFKVESGLPSSSDILSAVADRTSRLGNSNNPSEPGVKSIKKSPEMADKTILFLERIIAQD